MTYLFLDTNIFLHFTFFDEIKWKDLINDDFQIVVAPVVIDELDKHKRHSNSKIANRVKNVLNRIEEIIDVNQYKYPLIYHNVRPKFETFAKFSLDPKEQDDCLLATIKEFLNIHQPLIKIKFITNDTGPRIKAKSLKIETIKLGDQYLLPNDKTQEEQKILKLEKENSLLKNRIPKVAMCFSDDSVLLKINFIEFVDSRDAVIETGFQAIKNKIRRLIFQVNLPKVTETNSMEEKLSSIVIESNLILNRLSKGQVDKYNAELEEYFKEYLSYLAKDYEFQKRQSLSLGIDLQIRNDGNVPAEDIDILLHFPDGFSLYAADKYYKKPIAPPEPYRPKHNFDIFNQPSIYLTKMTSRNVTVTDLNMPTISKTNSNDVNIHLKGLKHHKPYKLDQMIIQFDTYKNLKSFCIDYELRISNVPSVISGKLNVVITK